MFHIWWTYAIANLIKYAKSLRVETEFPFFSAFFPQKNLGRHPIVRRAEAINLSCRDDLPWASFWLTCLVGPSTKSDKASTKWSPYLEFVRNLASVLTAPDGDCTFADKIIIELEIVTVQNTHTYYENVSFAKYLMPLKEWLDSRRTQHSHFQYTKSPAMNSIPRCSGQAYYTALVAEQRSLEHRKEKLAKCMPSILISSVALLAGISAFSQFSISSHLGILENFCCKNHQNAPLHDASSYKLEYELATCNL